MLIYGLEIIQGKYTSAEMGDRQEIDISKWISLHVSLPTIKVKLLKERYISASKRSCFFWKSGVILFSLKEATCIFEWNIYFNLYISTRPNVCVLGTSKAGSDERGHNNAIGFNKDLIKWLFFIIISFCHMQYIMVPYLLRYFSNLWEEIDFFWWLTRSDEKQYSLVKHVRGDWR